MLLEVYLSWVSGEVPVLPQPDTSFGRVNSQLFIYVGLEFTTGSLDLPSAAWVTQSPMDVLLSVLSQ